MGFYALAWLRAAPDETFVNAFLAFHNLLGLVGLYWYWIGLDLFGGAEDLVEWASQSIRRVVPPHLLNILILLLWVIWGVIGYVSIYSLPPTLFGLMPPKLGIALALGLASLAFSPPLFVALNCHLYLTGAIVLLTVGLWVGRKMSGERLVTLFKIWLFGFLVLYSYFHVLFASLAEAEEGSPLIAFWPWLLFVGGMSWEILQMSLGLISGSLRRLLLFMGFMLLFSSISALELSAQYIYFYRTLSINSFNGVLYLGVPYLLYTSIYEKCHYTPASPRVLGLLFVAGMLSAVPALIFERLFFVPLLWFGIILAIAWARGRWDERADGLVYGITVALGFVVFYTRPILIPLPLFTRMLGRFLQMQTQYAHRAIAPWESRWWLVLAIALIAGAFLGYALSGARWARNIPRALFFVSGAALSVLTLAIGDFVL
ncbi:MAG: hypothetical protein H5T69_00670 [Chloroflexi bacterium]|nr:hypothetical protein [Chloroflexota bacterium]